LDEILPIETRDAIVRHAQEGKNTLGATFEMAGGAGTILVLSWGSLILSDHANLGQGLLSTTGDR
jgi:hypothetical protein